MVSVLFNVGIGGHCESGADGRPTYRLTRSALLRGLGVVYVSAFGSLAVQLDGLIGSGGILPAADYLNRAAQVLGTGPATYWRLPTLFWLDTSDRALHGVCWGGLGLGVLLIAGILPGPCLALLWLFYLSLTVAGQVFLGYQWDALLLEAGLLALLLTPWCPRLDRSSDVPGPFAVWMFRWLVFRLMLQSGVVKLTSGDAVWRNWTALDYHYQTQPLPVWTSWYFHQLPPWFQTLSLAFMFYAELVAPFFIFGPRILRRIGFVSLVLFQALIAATGNYGFFNLLTTILCLSLLDDQDWSRAILRWRKKTESVVGFLPSPATPAAQMLAPPKPWSRPRRVALGGVAGVIFAVTAGQTLETVWPGVVVPVPIQVVSQWLEPLRIANSYGLFRVMTTERPEITVEGSDDGVSWKPYQFRWKPGELNRRPRFATPHLPRLDWQMWFAALAGDCRAAPWFIQFEERLLRGTPAVLALLGENPFPDRPPRYIRARLSLYTFSRPRSNDWWVSEERGLFCPPLSLGADSG
jgi:lipase maturation factor 1